jgi:hypothetical protein
MAVPAHGEHRTDDHHPLDDAPIRLVESVANRPISTLSLVHELHQ